MTLIIIFHLSLFELDINSIRLIKSYIYIEFETNILDN